MRDAPSEGDTYRVRLRPLSGDTTLTLRPDALVWRVEPGREERLAFRDIALVRLRFDPSRVIAPSRLLEIVPVRGRGKRLAVPSATWTGLVDRRAQDGPFTAFVRALHARLAAANPKTTFVAGPNPVRYWLFVALSALVVTVLAAAALVALHEADWLGFLLSAALAVYGARLGLVFARANRPGLYDPYDIPARLLP